MKPGKQRCQDLCWKTTLHNLLFCAHTQCMNYVTYTFLLVCSSERSKQLLCHVHGQGQKSEQKHTTKEAQGRTDFVEFRNHSPLLTMYRRWRKNMYPECFAAYNRSFARKKDPSGTQAREYSESNTK